MCLVRALVGRPVARRVRHRRDAGRVFRLDLAHVLENVAQLPAEEFDLGLGQREVGKSSDTTNVVGVERSGRHVAKSYHEVFEWYVPGTCSLYTRLMRARPGKGLWAWGAVLAAWVAIGGPSPGPDPGRAVVRAEAFAVRAVDVSGRRHPIATFDGRSWLIDMPAQLVGPPSPDPPAIVGLETSEGVPVSTVRVFAASGEPWGWAQRAVENLAAQTAAIGERKVTEVSMYVPAGVGANAVYVDVTVRTPDPDWRGAVVGAWVLPVEGTEPVVLGARPARFRSYQEFVRIPRRHPLGIAVAGAGGVQTWVMYNRARTGDTFELAGVSRRGLREHPPIPRGQS